MTARKHAPRVAQKQDPAHLLRLLALAFFFSAGVILGQVLSGRFSLSACEELTEYLTDYLSLDTTPALTGRTLLSALVLYFRYPLAAFFMGFVAAGAVLLPLWSVAYGFFLSFSVCCFTASFGADGVLLALAVFGIRCLVTLPCYFFLALPALETALARLRASFSRERRPPAPEYGLKYWARLGIAALVLLSGVLTELFVSPLLLQLVLTRIFL